MRRPRSPSWLFTSIGAVNWVDVGPVVNIIEYWLGGLDVLVHAAGIAPGAPAESIAVEDWDNVFAVNARGTFLTNQAAFRLLQESGGRIINFASAAGVMGMPGGAAYSASKAAVLGWTRPWPRNGRASGSPSTPWRPPCGRRCMMPTAPSSRLRRPSPTTR